MSPHTLTINALIPRPQQIHPSSSPMLSRKQKKKQQKSHKKGRTLGLDFHLEIPCPPANHTPRNLEATPNQVGISPLRRGKTKVWQPSKERPKSPVYLHCAPSLCVENNIMKAPDFAPPMILQRRLAEEAWGTYYDAEVGIQRHTI